MSTEHQTKPKSDKHIPSNRTVFSGAHDYFINNVLPDTIQARTTKLTAATSYANNNDETFILVRSGTGKLLVNGLEYTLKADTLINLGPFHRYRFFPTQGEYLEIAEARMNSSTYVYMIANPYLKCENLFIPSQPPVVYLRGLSAELARESMHNLLEEAKGSSPDKIEICFCYMMDFLGIITDNIPKKYFFPHEAN